MSLHSCVFLKGPVTIIIQSFFNPTWNRRGSLPLVSCAHLRVCACLNVWRKSQDAPVAMVSVHILQCQTRKVGRLQSVASWCCIERHKQRRKGIYSTKSELTISESGKCKRRDISLKLLLSIVDINMRKKCCLSFNAFIPKEAFCGKTAKMSYVFD